MEQLTCDMIQNAFRQTGVDATLFSKYEAFIKEQYEVIQREQPDDEGTPFEDSNASWCLQHSCSYIVSYAKEIEKGHGENWADAYARNSFDKNVKDFTAYNTWISIQDPEEKERELDVHANWLSKDPVFKEIYKKMVVGLFKNAEENAKNYAETYHGCINKGKSESFTKSYTYAFVFLEYSDKFCEIYARAYDEAITHGESESEATNFADFCIDAADQGQSIMQNDLAKNYTEDWQKEFYLGLM